MPLNKTLATIKRNLPSVAKANGFQARVTSGYRSKAAQTKLYNRWLAGLQQYPVAKPGTSDHEKGLALDVVSTDTTKLVSLLTAVGLTWAGPTDPVHFTLARATGAPKAKKQKVPAMYVYDINGKRIEKISAEDAAYLATLPASVQNFVTGKKSGVEKVIWEGMKGGLRALLKFF